MNRRRFLKVVLGAATWIGVFGTSRVWANHGEIQKLKLTEDEWKDRLSPDQFRILRKEGTERAFTSALNDEKREGVFVCAGCDLPLFEASKKYDSGTGWPSFWDVIPGHLETKTDFKLVYPRKEYHCARCGGHQGHVFNDGPDPTGLRYCNNGVALKFVPKTEAADEPVPSETAILAGGCFWCMQKPYDALSGVISTRVGYTGGDEPNPTYQAVSSGQTTHYEAIEVVFDPSLVSYKEILELFWKNVDYLDAEGQFCDRGPQYRTAIWVTSDTQDRSATQSKRALEERVRQRVVTPILPAKVFYPAEAYHQKYYKKNPIRYKYYRTGCGRDKRLKVLNS